MRGVVVLGWIVGTIVAALIALVVVPARYLSAPIRDWLRSRHASS
jgi:tetrahydromethanopterin S-methyltransferase subunit B